ncbi:MAG: DUF2141 domain-containing protein [Flavobacteriia bacterium]|jgi:uncharacterized protein (DUF2141 family)|nr:DUF2141 domain-containing protein [Cryomorphaceae bacterium]
MRTFILGFLVLFLVSAAESEKHFSLTIKVDNIKSVKGMMEISVYKDPAKFPKVGQTHRMIRVKVEGHEVSYTFEHLEADDYAVALFHDVNSNKVCDKNFFGIPTEAYGFSNNFKPVLSAPVFYDCDFDLSCDRTLKIHLIH